MNIFPAIDLIDGCAVRLFKGDYNQKTVYSNSPVDVAKSFTAAGAEYIHIVDLDGAKDGSNANIEVVRNIVKESGLKAEIGGGIRSMEAVEKYLDLGVMRVILGTAAVTDTDFLKKAVSTYGEKVAVGVDIKDGRVAIKGWTQVSQLGCFEFCRQLEDIGVKTVICTDISKDGVMSGTNIELYKQLSAEFNMDIVASGGVSNIDNVRTLAEMNMYGAILGKALYTGAIDLKEAIAVASGVTR
ncbi:MAG: 1-(5-phosphoribosyl)-5-[(5-phosphoribosylamino)methylideneamino]imidazole-4-carboxamide isomerase [Lachnospiraceae bacterium]|nr:1-(5-phosphoribosyl)-5-[(5-phosphoribosylamino)methylideneamino]imidazole-4-carboxamide isomerase [Lachnospiraceae bacterium]